MKRVFILFASIAIIAVSCSPLEMRQDSPIDGTAFSAITKSTILEQQDFTVTLEDVNLYLSSISCVKDQSKSNVVSIEGYPSKKDPLCYIINFDEGWQIISADKRTNHLLASDNTGHISFQDE